MKKFLIFALILAVAGGAFAQSSLNFSGFLRTGLAYRFNDADGAQGGLQWSHIDDFSQRAQLGIVLRNSEGNVEGHWNIQVNDNAIRHDGFSLRLNFMENNLRFAFSDAWNNPYWAPTGGNGDSFSIGGGPGAHTFFRPITDLTLFFSIMGLPNRTTAVLLPGRLLENLQYGAGLAYRVADVGEFNLYGHYHGTRGGNATNPAATGADANWDGNYGRISMSVGANLNPIVSSIDVISGVGLDVTVYDLTKVRTVLQNPLADYNYQTNPRVDLNAMDIRIGQRLGFVFGDLTLALNARQALRLYDDGDSTFGFRVLADFAYPLPDFNITPRFSVGYRMGNHGTNLTSNNAYRRIGETVGWNDEAFDGLSVIAFNPRVEFALSPGLALELGYTFLMNMGDAINPDHRTASTFNSIYLNVGVTF